MPKPRYVNFFRPTSPNAQRRQMMADILKGQAKTPLEAPPQRGRITPKMHVGQGLAHMGTQMLSAYQQKKAFDAQREDEERVRWEGFGLPPRNKNQAMANALSDQEPPERKIPSIGMSPELEYEFFKMDPQGYLEVVAKTQQGRSPIKLGAGDTLVDPESMQPLYQSPANEKLVPVVGPDGPTLVPESQAQGMTPYRTGGVNVDARNMGNIPQGYRLVEDEQGTRLEAIPGGPADTSEADANRQAESARQGDIVTQEIDRTLSLMDEGILPDTGVGAWLANVPNTDAKAIDNLLKTINSNIGFSQLQKMREASPTGGALGQVSEREIDFLQSVAGSLDQSQRREDLEYNLNRLWNAYQDVIHGQGQGPTRRSLERSRRRDTPQRITTDAEYDDLPSGTEFIDPEGNRRRKP